MRFHRFSCLSPLPWCLALAALILQLACGNAFGLLSKAEERKIGRKVVQQVGKMFRLLDDPYLNNYLNRIGHGLGQAMRADEFEMDFHVVADARINAFAVPGGHVFVTSELILVSNDESELAGVVAHEIGHVEGRHIAHRAETASKANLAAMAAVLAGLFLGAGSNAGAAVSMFGLAGVQTKMLQYSRDDEEDADRRGARALADAGYDGWGLVRFMETIRRQSPTPEGVPTYLFTHPIPENRATYLAAMLPPPTERTPTAAELGPLWRAQARVLVQDPRNWGIGFFQERLKNYPRSPDVLLGMALLLRTQGRYDNAMGLLREAQGLAPEDAEITHEVAATLLLQGHVGEGIALLEKLRGEGRATVPSLRDLGWAYLEAGDGPGALAVYDQLSEMKPRWGKVDYYRGLALGKAGREGEAHQTLGDYYGEIGRSDLARDHYRKALGLLQEATARAEVEKALRDLEEEDKGDKGSNEGG